MDDTDAMWVKNQLKRFTYKPGWTFEISKNVAYSLLSNYPCESVLVIKFEARNSYDPNGPTVTVTKTSYLPLFTIYDKNEDGFALWLQYEIFDLERHESREWLRRDGTIYDDPHK